MSLPLPPPPPKDNVRICLLSILTSPFTDAISYAFKFLIDIEHRLASSGIENCYIDRLRQRILSTCEGHVKWLAHVWGEQNHKLVDAGCFAANYWVTGKKMHRESLTWQPDDTTTDTALQILKITMYARTLETDHHASTYPNRPCDKLEWSKTFLTKIFVSWLHALDKLDVRAKYAWPHSKEDGVNTFRLEDHFWIWKALDSMKELGMWTQLPSPNAIAADKREVKLQTRSTKAEDDQVLKFLDRVGQREGFLKLICARDHNRETWVDLYQNFYITCQRMIPDKVLRSVLQRFTTTNDVSGMVSLSVTNI